MTSHDLLRPDWSEVSRTGSQRELTRTDSEHVQNCELSCKPVRASCSALQDHHMSTNWTELSWQFSSVRRNVFGLRPVKLFSLYGISQRPKLAFLLYGSTKSFLNYGNMCAKRKPNNASMWFKIEIMFALWVYAVSRSHRYYIMIN
jgi:hypothetical protein